MIVPTASALQYAYVRQYALVVASCPHCQHPIWALTRLLPGRHLRLPPSRTRPPSHGLAFLSRSTVYYHYSSDNWSANPKAPVNVKPQRTPHQPPLTPGLALPSGTADFHRSTGQENKKALLVIVMDITCYSEPGIRNFDHCCCVFKHVRRPSRLQVELSHSIAVGE